MLSRTVIILLLSALFLLQFAFAASFNKTFPDHLADVIVEITDDTADKLESGMFKFQLDYVQLTDFFDFLL
jgi:hypothetical protein